MLELIDGAHSAVPALQVIPLWTAGSRPPLVLVGLQPIFRTLTLRLPADQPVYGLSLFDTSTLPLPYRLEEIAAQYVGLLRRFGDGRPLVLAGWCVDGVLAYEMAQQLRAVGIDVPLLVLFDSYNPAAVRRGFWPSRNRWRFHLASVSRLDAAGLLAYARDRVQTLAARLRTRFWRAGYRRRMESGRDVDPSLRDPAQILNLAVAEYLPQPYPGSILLLRPESRPTGDFADPAFGWTGLVPHLRSVDVPGNHVEMFREPNVEAMAAALQSALPEMGSGFAEPEPSRPIGATASAAP
jgi:thioesterase domain-containing protein